ncbi:MAG: putative subtilase-type serine protease precursor [Verrucomicrobiales bacterium]|nr:putative subtilase-type serine protease precursor [Verrucomicrobiales bacterium]
MAFPTRLTALVCALLFSLPALAAEKKEEKKKPEPPSVAMVIPLAITPGTTNKIKIRGQNLTNVTEVKFARTNLHLTIKSKGKAEVPKEMDAKKVGDTQIEAELTLPEDAPLGTNAFTLVSADGESKPAMLVVLPAKSLVAEKEPNNSFRENQPLELGKTVQGAIGEAKDVDVFKLKCKAGQTLVAQVQAARLGSTLDSILTLYDEHGHQLAASDDSETDSDSLLRIKIPKNGTYLLSLIDAHDKGGATYVYLLTVRED